MQSNLAEVRMRVFDTTGQKSAVVNFVPPDSTVSELVDDLVRELNLAKTDVAGRPLSYSALVEDEGRALHGSERVADVVAPGSRVVLAPDVVAGGGR